MKKLIFSIPIISFLFFTKKIFHGVSTLKECYLLLGIGLLFVVFSFSKEKFEIGKTDLLLIAFSLFTFFNGLNFAALLLTGLTFYYLILSNELQGSKDFRLLFFALISVAGAQAFIGELQNYGMDLTGLAGFYKIVGTFNGPIFFVAAITTAIPLTLALYYAEKNKIVQNYAIVIGALIILALSVSNNRGAWLAALTGVAFFYGLRYSVEINAFFKDNIFRKVSTGLAVIVVLLGMIGALYSIRPVSADARLLMWKVGFNAFLEHPAVGIGYGNMQHDYMEYQADFFRDEKNVDKYIDVVGNVDHIHNEYIQLLAETGVTGFTLFAVFMSLIFYFSLKLLFKDELKEKDKYYLSGALSAVLSALVIAFFGYFFYFPYIAVFFFAYLAVIAVILKHNCLPVFDFKINKSLKYALIGLSLFAFIFMSKSAYDDISARKIWQNAFLMSLSGDKAHAIEEYKSVYPQMKNNGEFLFNLGALYVSKDSCDKGIELLQRAKSNYSNPKLYIALGRGYEKLGNYNKAVENYQRASYMMPHQMFPHYLMAKLHQKQGNKQEAQSEAQKVIDIPIRVKSAAVYEMKNEMKKLITE